MLKTKCGLLSSFWYDSCVKSVVTTTEQAILSPTLYNSHIFKKWEKEGKKTQKKKTGYKLKGTNKLL